MLLFVWGIARFSSKAVSPFYIPLSNVRESDFSTSSSKPVIVWLFDSNYSTECEMVSHRSFDLHFPDDYWYQEYFHVLIGHLYIFGEMSIQIIGLIFKRLFCLFIIELQGFFIFLDIRPLSDIWFAYVFSYLWVFHFLFSNFIKI